MPTQFAKYRDGLILITTQSGAEICFPVAENPRLANGAEEQLNRIELSPFGLHWPELDEDLSSWGVLGGDHGQRRKAATGVAS